MPRVMQMARKRPSMEATTTHEAKRSRPSGSGTSSPDSAAPVNPTITRAAGFGIETGDVEIAHKSTEDATICIVYRLEGVVLRRTCPRLWDSVMAADEVDDVKRYFLEPKLTGVTNETIADFLRAVRGDVRDWFNVMGRIADDSLLELRPLRLLLGLIDEWSASIIHSYLFAFVSSEAAVHWEDRHFDFVIGSMALYYSRRDAEQCSKLFFGARNRRFCGLRCLYRKHCYQCQPSTEITGMFDEKPHYWVLDPLGMSVAQIKTLPSGLHMVLSRLTVRDEGNSIDKESSEGHAHRLNYGIRSDPEGGPFDWYILSLRFKKALLELWAIEDQAAQASQGNVE